MANVTAIGRGSLVWLKARNAETILELKQEKTKGSPEAEGLARLMAWDFAKAGVDEYVTQLATDAYQRYHGVNPPPDSMAAILDFDESLDSDQPPELRLRLAIHARRLLDAAEGRLG